MIDYLDPAAPISGLEVYGYLFAFALPILSVGSLIGIIILKISELSDLKNDKQRVN